LNALHTAVMRCLPTCGPRTTCAPPYLPVCTVGRRTEKPAEAAGPGAAIAVREVVVALLWLAGPRAPLGCQVVDEPVEGNGLAVRADPVAGQE
jgi:hypothetical protein